MTEGSGFDNVIAGVMHFPKHVLDWIHGGGSSLANSLNAVLEELVAYEKAHGKEQLDIAAHAGITEYNVARAEGKTKGEAILRGVAAAFNSEAAEIKKLSTNAMTAYMSGKTT